MGVSRLGRFIDRQLNVVRDVALHQAVGFRELVGRTTGSQRRHAHQHRPPLHRALPPARITVTVWGRVKWAGATNQGSPEVNTSLPEMLPEGLSGAFRTALENQLSA